MLLQILSMPINRQLFIPQLQAAPDITIILGQELAPALQAFARGRFQAQAIKQPQSQRLQVRRRARLLVPRRLIKQSSRVILPVTITMFIGTILPE